MQKTTVKLSASTIYQLEAGEQKAVIDGGDLYILVHSVEGVSAGTATATSSTASSAGVSASAPASTDSGEYTEEQLSGMSQAELVQACADLGIDTSIREGRNTPKKLTNLILDFQAGKLDAPAQEEAKAEVVDDTAPAEQSAPSGRAKRTPRTAPAQEENKLIPVEDWEKLEEGAMVLVKLDLEDPKEAEKLWEAQVTGWDTPDGMKEEFLYVAYLADNTEDFLRPDTDKLYEYKKQL